MAELENLLRETLAEDGAAYPVSVGALGRLEERLAGVTEQAPPAPTAPSRHRRYGLAGAALVSVAAAVAVLVAVLTPTTRHAPAAVSIATGRAPSEAPTPAPPASFTAVKTLGLRFTASRLLLGGADVYAFGADSADHPWVARIHDQAVIRQERLPSLVCSASLDGTGVIAVVVQHGPDGRACTDRGGRGTLGLVDPVSLTMLSPSVPARGGDTLVRPEGVYVADAGVLRLLTGTTLAPSGVSYRLGGADAVVNLAGDPGQPVIFATVFDPGHPTRLFFLRRDTLTLTRNEVNLAADQGALPYATADGAVWVSLAGAGASGPAGDNGFADQGSQAELHPAGGPVKAFAFEGSPLLANFAESGTRLWSLDSDGTLRCASLTSGDLAGASAAPAPGVIAADPEHVYVAPLAHQLDVLTPSATCGG